MERERESERDMRWREREREREREEIYHAHHLVAVCVTISSRKCNQRTYIYITPAEEVVVYVNIIGQNLLHLEKHGDAKNVFPMFSVILPEFQF